jgi:hypothetical protein
LDQTFDLRLSTFDLASPPFSIAGILPPEKTAQNGKETVKFFASDSHLRKKTKMHGKVFQPRTDASNPSAEATLNHAIRCQHPLSTFGVAALRKSAAPFPGISQVGSLPMSRYDTTSLRCRAAPGISPGSISLDSPSNRLC